MGSRYKPNDEGSCQLRRWSLPRALTVLCPTGEEHVGRAFDHSARATTPPQFLRGRGSMLLLSLPGCRLFLWCSLRMCVCELENTPHVLLAKSLLQTADDSIFFLYDVG